MIFLSEDLRLRAPLCKACLWAQSPRGWIQGAVWADLKEPGDDRGGHGCNDAAPRTVCRGFRGGQPAHQQEQLARWVRTGVKGLAQGRLSRSSGCVLQAPGVRSQQTLPPLSGLQPPSCEMRLD